MATGLKIFNVFVMLLNSVHRLVNIVVSCFFPYLYSIFCPNMFLVLALCPKGIRWDHPAKK